MPSHQERRDPLPKDYQHPTHGVDCDCVTCRNRWVMPEPMRPLTPSETEWMWKQARQIVAATKLLAIVNRPYDSAGGAEKAVTLRIPLEPTADTPWAV